MAAAVGGPRRTTLSGAIWAAAEHGDAAAVEALLDMEGYPGPDCRSLNQSTLLHCAAKRGHLQLAAALLARGADVNALDYGGMRRTPLHWVSPGGSLGALPAASACPPASVAVGLPPRAPPTAPGPAARCCAHRCRRWHAPCLRRPARVAMWQWWSCWSPRGRTQRCVPARTCAADPLLLLFHAAFVSAPSCTAPLFVCCRLALLFAADTQGQLFWGGSSGFFLCCTAARAPPRTK